MKKFFTATAILAALAAVPALADTSSAIRATIPFEFHVGTAVLPAGEYQVTEGLTNQTLRVQSTDGKHSATVLAYSQDAPPRVAGKPGLGFRHVDGKAYLASVTRASSADTRGPMRAGYAVLARVR